MSITFPSVPRFGRDVKLLIAASTLASLSFLGANSILRVLYVLRLGHGPEYLGIYSAAGAWTYSAMSIPSGALGTRFGARQVMLAGLAIVVLGMLSLPMSEAVPAQLWTIWPIASQMITISGWSMFNVNLVPALMGVTSAEDRNSAYAVHAAVRGLGTFLGTLFGGWMPGLMVPVLGQGLDAPGPYRVAIIVGAGLFALAAFPMSFVQVGRVVPKVRAKVQGKFPFGVVLPIALYIGLSHAGWATCRSFCNAYLDQELLLSPSAIGQLTAAGQAIAIVVPLLMPRLAKRRSGGWVLVTATFGIAASLVPIGLIPHWAGAAGGRIGVLIFSAIRMPAMQVLQMELVDASWRSLAYGAGSMAMSFGFGLMSLAGGYIIAASGYRSLFLIGAAICAGAALWLSGVLARKRRTAALVES